MASRSATRRNRKNQKSRQNRRTQKQRGGAGHQVPSKRVGDACTPGNEWMCPSGKCVNNKCT